MKEGTTNKPSTLKQVIRGLLIAAIIGILVITVLSLASRPLHGPRGEIETTTSLAAMGRAVQSFESEYQRLPDVSSLDLETEGPQGVKLITILLGKETTPEPEMQNHRQIAFLTARNTKNKKRGGLVYYSANEIVGIYDGWGNPLRVILHPPEKTEITISHLGKQLLVKEPVVVLSRGADEKWGTKDDLMWPR